MNRLYVPQLMKVKIILEPSELCKDYEKKIKNKLIDTYGGHCYQNGFIKKSSIEIVKIENGSREGSHLHGFMTFNVEFSAMYCIPRKDVIIPCCIKSINKFGVVAYAYPVDIMIPRQLQTYDNTIDLLKDLYEGEYIHVKIKDYTIEKDRLIAVGIVTDVGLDSPNAKELPLDGLLDVVVVDPMGSRLPDVPMGISKVRPSPDEKRLGTNKELNQLKDRIAPFSVERKGEMTLWEREIRGRTNKYELVDKHKRTNLVIKYNNFSQVYDENSLYPVISRAYFKLWEILVDMNILDKFKDQAINIANLAEGPGGFIQCLLDYRNHQHKQEWKKDTYNTITIKRDPTVKALEQTLDWEYKPGKEYFDMIVKRGYHVNRSYGVTGDGNLLKLENIDDFTQKIGDNKCQLITSDGAIYSKEEEFETQELDNAKLFCAEILTALHNQADGGTFIIKIYDIYYDLTIQMIYILTTYYNEIKLIKPKTSRPANSEKYLVCEKFKGISDEDLEQISDRFSTWIECEKNNTLGRPDNQYVTKFLTFAERPDSKFIETIHEFNKYNLELQMVKINEGLEIAIQKLYEDKSYVAKITEEQVSMGKEWCKKYKVPFA